MTNDATTSVKDTKSYNFRFCADCWRRARENEDYLGALDVQTESVDECENGGAHPSLKNWRVFRTLASLQYWASQPVGFRDKRCPTPITLAFGYVHRRNAEVILFEYEKYFIDFLIEVEYLEQVDTARYIDGVLPRAVRLTAKGDAALMEYTQKRKGT